MAVQRSDSPWTYAELAALPDDGKRYEIIEGTLFELPKPDVCHALAISNLIVALLPVVQSTGGRLSAAPVNVFFHAADPVKPDLVMLAPDASARVTERGIEDVPDLVVEVVSPSHRDHDELTKRALYGREGVSEYWIVDPEMRSIQVLTLERDALHRRHVFVIGEVLTSPLLPEVAIPVTAIFTGLDDLVPTPARG